MRFDRIRAIVEDVPFMTPDQGKVIYDFVLESKAREILELGFAHGTSTCYMAAALEEQGGGRVTTIDLPSARERTPNLDELLKRSGLERYVHANYAHTSYNWELMRIIERQSGGGVCLPLFDFCFIDGAHTWEADGLAFFLVDKLLKPGGWILFDDVGWTFANSPALKDTAFVKNMPEDERTTAQVGQVLKLLVGQHPGYHAVELDAGWGWAQKDSQHGNARNGPLRRDSQSRWRRGIARIRRFFSPQTTPH